MSDSESSENSELLDPEIKLPISLRLHEAIALCVLYERSPEELDLWDDGVWWGESVDLAMLRIAEAISKAMGLKEGLLRAGALRAQFDQDGVSP